MNVATYIFGWVMATLLGAVFHLWKDGGFWKLVIYIVLSWIGFFLGHLIAKSAGFNFMNVGSLYLGGGIIGSIIILFAGHWFSRIESFPGQSK
ncbi:MAG TPA: hypothetical protein PLO13_03690 [Anaerolineaceae bacterium]|nr:hypothetical protein [Anaerolineaceae bacterium]